MLCPIVFAARTGLLHPASPIFGPMSAARILCFVCPAVGRSDGAAPPRVTDIRADERSPDFMLCPIVFAARTGLLHPRYQDCGEP
jgi:hypothetical protein